MQEQHELDLGVDYGWFHVMRPRLVAGLVRDIGETAWAVYCIIKCHAQHTTGRAHPSQERIGEMIGKTAETVGRATKVLADAGLLREEKRGRHKEYVILESAPVSDRRTGTPHGSADFDYVPADFAKQLLALREFAATGLPPGHGITLNVNINVIKQGDHGVVNIQQVTLEPTKGGIESRKAEVIDLTDRLRTL